LPNKYLSRQPIKGTKIGGLAEVKQNFGGLAGENTENWQLAEVDIILAGLPHGSYKEKPRLSRVSNKQKAPRPDTSK
jgi:hypothetical protein